MFVVCFDLSSRALDYTGAINQLQVKSLTMWLKYSENLMKLVQLF